MNANNLVRVHCRATEVQGVSVFYREAGRAEAPTVLLLHGFAASSYLFRELIPALAQDYRVIAPDLPGFGQTTVQARQCECRGDVPRDRPPGS